MIKMILADDEPVIIRGLQKLVDFNVWASRSWGNTKTGKPRSMGFSQRNRILRFSISICRRRRESRF